MGRGAEFGRAFLFRAISAQIFFVFIRKYCSDRVDCMYCQLFKQRHKFSCYLNCIFELKRRFVVA